MDDIKYCRACLVTDVRMYSIKIPYTLKTYLKLLTSETKAPLVLCFECVALLSKCEQFRAKCVKATSLLKTVSKITKENIQVLDGKQHRLSLSATETFEISGTRDESDNNDNFEELVSYHHARDLHVKVENRNKNDITKDNKLFVNKRIANDAGVSSLNDIKIDVLLNEENGANGTLFDILTDNSSDVKHELASGDAVNKNVLPLGIKTELVNKEDSLSSINSSNGSECIADIDVIEGKPIRKRKKKFEIGLPKELSKISKAIHRRKSIRKKTVNKKKCDLTSNNREKTKFRKEEKDEEKELLDLEENFIDKCITVDLLSHEESENKISLKKRIYDETDNPLMCGLCYEAFTTENSHREHMKKHTSEYGKFVCASCNLHFEHQSALRSHEDDEHKHKYTCKVCSFICYSRDDVNNHVDLHINSKTKLQTRKINASEEFRHTESAKKPRPVLDLNYYEGYATIVSMTPEEAKNEILSRKATPNYVNCEFKCDLCFRGYEKKDPYENHMKKHSTERGKYECEFCHFRFPNQRQLNKHTSTAHKRKFSCNICDYVCFISGHAKIHVKMHKGTTYTCEECGKMFGLPNSLMMHKRNKHSTTVVCDYCGSAFGTEIGLRVHKNLAHAKETNPQLGPVCDLCNVHFANEAAWKKHLVLSAKHSVSNGCQHCGEVFESASALKTHLRVHARKHWSQQQRRDDKLPTTCTMCGELLSNGAEWRKHLLGTHPESKAAEDMQASEKPQCVCEVCGKTFKSSWYVNYHMRVHTKPYTCVDCGKSYVNSGSLVDHRAANHGAGPRHRCQLCPKTFRLKSSWYRHVREHMGIRPHKCQSCDKSFQTPHQVRLHMRHTHYKVPWPKYDRRRPPKPTSTADQHVS